MAMQGIREMDKEEIRGQGNQTGALRDELGERNHGKEKRRGDRNHKVQLPVFS